MKNRGTNLAPSKPYNVRKKLRRIKSSKKPRRALKAFKLVPGACEFNAGDKRLVWTLPIQLISPNVQMGWHTKHSMNSRIKKKMLVLKPKDIEQVKLPCKITLIRIGPRCFDFDNLVYCFKMVRDFVSDILRPGMAPGQADADESLIKFEYNQENNRAYGFKIVFDYA